MAKDDFDDEFLSDFGRTPSPLRRLVYFLLSLPPTVAALCLFIRLFLINPQTSQLTLLLSLILSATPLSVAVHQLSFVKSARIRRSAVPPTKSSFPDARLHAGAMRRFEAAISSGSLWYSMGYNFIVYMVVVVCVGLYVLREHVAGDLNLLVAGSVAGGVAWWNSNSALKAIGE